MNKFRRFLFVLLVFGTSTAFLASNTSTEAKDVIIIQPVSGLVTSEAGDQASFTIQLKHRPFFPVTIELESSDTSEGLVEPDSVTLNFFSYKEPQLVTISGIDDIQVDGNITYTVFTAPAISSDPEYHLLDASDVFIINEDNDNGPTSQDDSATTNEDEPVTTSVLDNDILIGLPPFSLSVISSPTRGTATVNSDSTITYTPMPSFFGSDLYSYQICDSLDLCSASRVVLTVIAVNDPPTAEPDAYEIGQNETLNTTAPGVLANDGDVDRDSLASTLKDLPANGVLNFKTDGSFIYVPHKDFVGTDTFTYQSTDGSLFSVPAQVSIEVQDLQSPTVNWLGAYQDEESYQVGYEKVLLQAGAEDNVAVDHVLFFRWDPLLEEYVDIAMVSNSPYQFELDTHSLVSGWNQIFVRSFDQAGNSSTRHFIWLYRRAKIFLPLLSH